MRWWWYLADGVIGIVSERDVVRALQERGADLLRLPVSEIMTTFVATCTPNDSVDSLSVLMTTKRVRHIPVMENGRLTGIVSIGDVVKTRMEELEATTGAAAGLHHPWLTSRSNPRSGAMRARSARCWRARSTTIR